MPGGMTLTVGLNVTSSVHGKLSATLDSPDHGQIEETIAPAALQIISDWIGMHAAR